MARTTRHFTLRLGDLVGRSILVYLRNLLPFVLLSAIVMAPWIAGKLWVETLPLEAPKVYRLATVGLGLFQALLGFVLTGAVTYGVVQQLSGRPASIAASLAKGLSSFFGVLGTSFLCGMRILLYSLLLWIPGIIESVRLYVAVPAAVMEGVAGNRAADRSSRLTLGSRWPIFGAWMLMLLIAMGLGFASGFVLALLHGGAGDVEEWTSPHAPGWIYAVCLDIGIQVLVTPFAATSAAVAYFMLRQGKENVDAAQLAAVFD